LSRNINNMRRTRISESVASYPSGYPQSAGSKWTVCDHLSQTQRSGLFVH
jgi:hypothetical protein